MTPARTNLFDRLVGWSLANRLFVLAAALALLVAGAFGLQRLPVDVFPDLDKPTVTLMTEAGGMAPEEVEQLVSFPLETAMNGMPGVTRVRSVSGLVTMEKTRSAMHPPVLRAAGRRVRTLWTMS